MKSAVAVVLGRAFFPALQHRTYFEIRGLCEVQNRGSRPWLVPVLTAISLIVTGDGIKINYLTAPSVTPLIIHF